MPQDSPISTDTLLLIVVGAHIMAELRDRPLAYRLRERILRSLDIRSRAADAAPGIPNLPGAASALGSGVKASTGGFPTLDPVHSLTPLVCTDLWYLNASDLAERPTIAIGEPGVNAASALISTRMPTAFVMEHALRVHLDVEFLDLKACMWGVSHAATASAVDVFIERYLDQFLDAACD